MLLKIVSILSTEIAQPLQSIIDIEKSRLPSHRIISEPSVTMGIRKAANWRGFLESIHIAKAMQLDPKTLMKCYRESLDHATIMLCARVAPHLGKIATTGRGAAAVCAHNSNPNMPVTGSGSPLCVMLSRKLRAIWPGVRISVSPFF